MVISNCLHSFRESRRHAVHIPEDIVIDILSRIPTDDAIKCRRVCKKWREIISTPSFAELQLKIGATSAPSSTFIHKRHHVPKDKFDYHICEISQIDSTKIRTRWFHDTISALLEPAVSCSVDGLLAFHSLRLNKHVCVMNPVVKECVCLEFPFYIFRPCGIYCDPLTRDYKLLLITPQGNDLCEYYVFSLKTNVMKKLEYFSCWRTKIGYSRMIPSNGSLHWFVGKTTHVCHYNIMVFNNATEDFRVLPHPRVLESTCHKIHLFNLELLETSGKLWFFYESGHEMQVWVLEDHANWAWERRYNVSLNWCARTFHSNGSRPVVQVVGIHNGVDLLISVYGRGMFWYNLQLNTFSKALISENDEFLIPVGSLAYTKTLVRLMKSLAFTNQTLFNIIR